MPSGIFANKVREILSWRTDASQPIYAENIAGDTRAYRVKAFNLSTKQPISTDAVLSVEKVTGGLVNRYAVTVDIDRL